MVRIRDLKKEFDNELEKEIKIVNNCLKFIKDEKRFPKMKCSYHKKEPAKMGDLTDEEKKENDLARKYGSTDYKKFYYIYKNFFWLLNQKECLQKMLKAKCKKSNYSDEQLLYKFTKLYPYMEEMDIVCLENDVQDKTKNDIIEAYIEFVKKEHRKPRSVFYGENGVISQKNLSKNQRLEQKLYHDFKGTMVYEFMQIGEVERLPAELKIYAYELDKALNEMYATRCKKKRNDEVSR